jgi:hypothetical protein
LQHGKEKESRSRSTGQKRRKGFRKEEDRRRTQGARTEGGTGAMGEGMTEDFAFLMNVTLSCGGIRKIGES